MTRIEHLTSRIQPQRDMLLQHPVYSSISNMEDLRLFMEAHVFAVWDFMSLLKALQIKLTCVELPWRPVADPELRHLINEIVLAEESDVAADGRHMSHFELYHESMVKAGANTSKIDALVQGLQQGRSWLSVLQELDIPIGVKNFVDFSVSTAMEASPHEIAAVFTFGREDLIPDMFTRMVADLEHHFPNQLADFRYYLDRHIELDGDEHGPMALRMVSHLCGDDARKWAEAEAAALAAIRMRERLWDAVMESLPARTYAG